MATFLLLNIPSPVLTSKTTILPHYKLTHKSIHLNTCKNPFSPNNLTITKPHKNASSPSLAAAGKEVSSPVESENETLHHDLRQELIPKHVAMIMEKDPRGDSLPEVSYRADRRSVIEIARICCDLGIKVLSVYTCSSQNNPQNEGVEFNMNLTKSDLEELSRNDIRVSVIGDRKNIPESLMETITHLEESTKNNKSFHIIETVNYSGHFDILQSCVALAEKVNDGVLQPEEIDENVFRRELETKFMEFPDPDLVIRTGGRSNVGNFMLWQSAYAEICFVEKDGFQFDKRDFVEVLTVYQKRNRRFGGSDKK